jgi:hypothetical protein
MYNKYKQKLASRNYQKWAQYKVELKPEIAEKLKEFKSSDT